jgi:hypothetical protein
MELVKVWKKHENYMKNTYGWGDKEWNQYKNHLTDILHQNTKIHQKHKEYMRQNYDWNNDKWKNYKNYMKQYSHDPEPIKLPTSMRSYGKVDSNLKNNDTKEIEELLSNPPKSWRKMFREEKISETPTIKEVLSLLNKTAGGAESFETEGSKSFPVPKDVKEAAMKGIRLSHKFDYPSYRGIGLARAIQLVTQQTVNERSLQRMRNFFVRNQRYTSYINFNNDTKPSRSYLAWLNWGGDPGYKWSSKF